MGVLQRCSVAMARWAWRLGMIHAMGWWAWVTGFVAGDCCGCDCAIWLAVPELLGGCGAFPFPFSVWGFGGASLGVIGGCSGTEGVPVTSWRGSVDMVLSFRVVGAREQ